MATGENLGLNSFNDVASYITKENERLTRGIVETLKTEIASVRNECKSEVELLASDLNCNLDKVTSEQVSQSTRIARLEDTIARLQRNSELVISGIPVVTGESCSDIVHKIAVAIGWPDALEKISAFRLHKTGKSRTGKNHVNGTVNIIPPLIMVKFGSALDKSNFFSKYLTSKSLCLMDVGFQSDSRIYIKENLTPSNYRIFQACAAAKRNNSVSKLHTRDGICYFARPSNNSLIAIHTIDDLNDLLSDVTDNNSKAPRRQQPKRKRELDINNQQGPTSFTKKKRNQRYRDNTTTDLDGSQN